MKTNNVLPTEAAASAALRFLLSACLILFLRLDARAEVLVPSLYTATPGEGSAHGHTSNYFDDTGSQLIDGAYGANQRHAGFGNGHSYEWVGWRVANPTITFYFPEPVTIDEVGIDFGRARCAAYSFLPSTVNIGGTDFTVAANALRNGTCGMLDFSGSWTGTTLTVTLTDNRPNRWILVDEITFHGVAVPVPEPSALVLGIGALGFLAIRRRRCAL
jgi:hypothetical protein